MQFKLKNSIIHHPKKYKQGDIDVPLLLLVQNDMLLISREDGLPLMKIYLEAFENEDGTIDNRSFYLCAQKADNDKTEVAQDDWVAVYPTDKL
jgi:hypothetical protein